MAKVIGIVGIAAGIGFFLSQKKGDAPKPTKGKGRGSTLLKKQSTPAKATRPPAPAKKRSSGAQPSPSPVDAASGEVEDRREALAAAAEHRIEQQYMAEAAEKGDGVAIDHLVAKVANLEKKSKPIVEHAGKLSSREEATREQLVMETKAAMGALDEIVADDDDIRAKRRTCIKAAKSLLSSLEIAAMSEWTVSGGSGSGGMRG
eukprot:CAMPEP_0182864762 /NCGR_PEP_ID=MMETSP0034_2-20130328/7334_1 /TAXON_ID=156128 /ORGANISM="Nephroselmis pyriformis, Strain CCMP717" /LENGTH=203 /DNA_ID=CAMNT_0024997025 /DNA_START=20 /DNA_END=628 /DNA_ORIENTATION=-